VLITSVIAQESKTSIETNTDTSSEVHNQSSAESPIESTEESPEENPEEFSTTQELPPLTPLQELLLNDVGYSFIEAFATIRQLYIDDVDDDVILEGAIEGMIAALEDPYSYYLEPLTAELENENRTGSYSGIGINLSNRSRQDTTTIEVTRINALGPAKRAGLRRGDIFKILLSY